jgi:hypothetical protein
MLSEFIDWLYFRTRYAIWGPEVTFTDGTIIGEGRPSEEREFDPVVAIAERYGSVHNFYDQLVEDNL